MGYTLNDCPGYSPDIQAMGDCRNCGHTPQAHDRKASIVTYIESRSIEELFNFETLLKRADFKHRDLKSKYLPIIDKEITRRANRTIEFLGRLDADDS